jgi:hypothetical protein
MPVGKGRTLLRCSIRTDLYEALSEEAREKELDLGSVVEGHLEHSRMLSRAEHQLIERRLDTLSHGQEQMLRLLESLVTRLEQGPMTHDVSSDEDTPPVATYDQMYGAMAASSDASGEPQNDGAEQIMHIGPLQSGKGSPMIMPTETPKRSWRPW